MSMLLLATATRRVENEHAVGTIVVRDGVGLATWLLLWVVAVTIVLPGTVLLGLHGSPFWWAAVALAPVGMAVVSAGVAQRLQVWWRWRGHGDVLAIGDVAADPPGHGHGRALVVDLCRLADTAGRAMVLRVAAANPAAVRLYRQSGFGVVSGAAGARLSMKRPTQGTRPTLATAPPWLAPIPISARALVTGTIAAICLTAVYWGTPVAWLMPPACVFAAIAADCDARWLRIPNRLLAAGFVVQGSLLVGAADVLDLPWLAAALAGGLIGAAPLFTLHILTGGRTPGLGDVKLAGVLGMVAGAVDPALAATALLLSLLIGAAIGAFRSWFGRGTRHPLGPALAVGFGITIAVWAISGGPTTW